MTIQPNTFFENLSLVTFGGSRAFVVLSATLVLFLGAYLGLLNATVSNVVSREQYEKRLTVIYSNIGELESTYLAEKNTVTLASARSLGFVEASPVQFVSRMPLKNRLSLNANEI